MREADRDVQLGHVLVGQLDGLPLAVGGRAAADVDDDVDDRPAGAADQLGLARVGLEVHAPHDPAARPGVVVLHPVVGDTVVGEDARAVGLGEEAARVAVDRGLDQQRAVQVGRCDLHGREGSGGARQGCGESVPSEPPPDGGCDSRSRAFSRRSLTPLPAPLGAGAAHGGGPPLLRRVVRGRRGRSGGLRLRRRAGGRRLAQRGVRVGLVRSPAARRDQDQAGDERADGHAGGEEQERPRERRRHADRPELAVGERSGPAQGERGQEREAREQDPEQGAEEGRREHGRDQGRHQGGDRLGDPLVGLLGGDEPLRVVERDAAGGCRGRGGLLRLAGLRRCGRLRGARCRLAPAPAEGLVGGHAAQPPGRLARGGRGGRLRGGWRRVAERRAGPVDAQGDVVGALAQRRVHLDPGGLERGLHPLGTGRPVAVREQRAQVVRAQVGGAAVLGRGRHLAGEDERALDVVEAGWRGGGLRVAGIAHGLAMARGDKGRRGAHTPVFPVGRGIHSSSGPRDNKFPTPTAYPRCSSCTSPVCSDVTAQGRRWRRLLDLAASLRPQRATKARRRIRRLPRQLRRTTPAPPYEPQTEPAHAQAGRLHDPARPAREARSAPHAPPRAGLRAPRRARRSGDRLRP